MPQDRDVSALVNEVLARVLGATFFALVVAVGIAMLAVGVMGILRTRHHHPRIA